jgi:hypothetical protein
VLVNYPRYLFLFWLVALWLAAHLGVLLQRRWPLQDDERNEFGIVQAACLTLMGLIIGFSFSMAINRYDLRKNDEAAEANAIGTEYVRAGLLPAENAALVRAQLRSYVGLRILFYKSRSDVELRPISADTARLQGDMWAAVQTAAVSQPSAVNALVASGMNDVLNSQGYTQAAWWNRIPSLGWTLMLAIAVCCNLLVGYGKRGRKTNHALLLILPVVISVSFLLIADIDSPRGGFIHVIPQNLASLSDGLR